VIIAHHRASIKSSKSLENKGFIAICSALSLYTVSHKFILPRLLIRANTRRKNVALQETLKALADPTHRQIIQLLKNGDCQQAILLNISALVPLPFQDI